jgi:hypothetical protein
MMRAKSGLASAAEKPNSLARLSCAANFAERISAFDGTQPVFRHPGLHGRGNQRADQPGGAGADDDEIAVEALRPAVRRVDAARADRIDELARDQRKQAEQHEGADQARREDAAGRFELPELGAGIHVDRGAGEHADLRHPVEGPHADARQAHQQVDHEEREQRHQPQCEQIERTVALDAGVDCAQALAIAALNGVSGNEARDQHRQRRADARRERDQGKSPGEAEDRAAGECHHSRAGQRQRGDSDIGGEEREARNERLRVAPGEDCIALRLERVERQIATEIEGEKRTDQRRKHGNHQQLAQAHPAFPRSASSDCAACKRNGPPHASVRWPADNCYARVSR